uniref:Uncharacterized protein n=2 Tax=Populus TaxID=3689 RepID=A0A4U5NLE0_POPAL|nr:hypothetical protein D5086_0000257490 [Populus alba]
MSCGSFSGELLDTDFHSPSTMSISIIKVERKPGTVQAIELVEAIPLIHQTKQTPFYYSDGLGLSAGVDSLCSEDEVLYQDERELQDQTLLGYAAFDDLKFDGLSPSTQNCQEEITKLGEIVQNGNQERENKKEKRSEELHLASLELLRRFGNGFRLLKSGRIYDAPPYTAVESQGFSTEEIMGIAGAKFIQPASQSVDVSSMFDNPFDLSLAGLSHEDAKMVELSEFLLASAEKVSCEQFDSDRRLLEHCEECSSDVGNTVERVVYYFSEALRERIEIKSGRVASNGLKKNQSAEPDHFAGIQAIVENVAEAKRIHIIDLEIRNGAQWAILMQALASRYNNGFGPLDLKENLVKIDDEEKIAVYSSYLPRKLIAMPNRLDSMMKMIRNINPCIMVVTEVEENHSAPSFVHRFVDLLFYYSAFFDCLDACMERDDPNRMITESLYLGEGIRNSVASEGEERIIRSVKLDVWRAFFARFGMVETDLSSSSLYQAKLIVKKFNFASSFTPDVDGKSLVFGWKGTPLHSLSAWNFT